MKQEEGVLVEEEGREMYEVVDWLGRGEGVYDEGMEASKEMEVQHENTIRARDSEDTRL